MDPSAASTARSWHRGARPSGRMIVAFAGIVLVLTPFSPSARSQVMPQSSRAPLWEARYDGPVSGTDVAFDLQLSPDLTHLYVTGWSSGTTETDYATVAYE